MKSTLLHSLLILLFITAMLLNCVVAIASLGTVMYLRNVRAVQQGRYLP